MPAHHARVAKEHYNGDVDVDENIFKPVDRCLSLLSQSETVVRILSRRVVSPNRF